MFTIISSSMFVRIKYNNVREKYTKKNTNSSPQNSQIRWTVQKVQGEKPSKKARFSVYLYFITERMRYFAYLRRTYIYARAHIRTNVLHTVHRSVLAWRTILMATSLQRRLFRRCL